MINTIQRRMIGQAALVLLVGMLAGFGLVISLVGGMEVWPGHLVILQLPGAPDAWVRAHIGGMMNAFLIMLGALALPVLNFDERGARRISWMLVGTGWANTIFYWAALMAPNRALTFADNRFGASNIAAVIGLVPALLFAVIAMVATYQIARQAWR